MDIGGWVSESRDQGVNSLFYQKDPKGIKVAVLPDVTTRYVYDGGQVIAEYDNSADTSDPDDPTTYDLVRKFIYGPGIDEPVCMINVDTGGNETLYFYHYDGLGSVIALSNESGTIVEAYSYHPFGVPTVHTSAGADLQWLTSDDDLKLVGQDTVESEYGNPYMYTARRYDPESDLYYYRARYYKPDLGRFLQPDPIGYAGGMNTYAYCGNNPVNFVDPFGLFPGWPNNKNMSLGDKWGYFGASLVWAVTPSERTVRGSTKVLKGTAAISVTIAGALALPVVAPVAAFSAWRGGYSIGSGLDELVRPFFTGRDVERNGTYTGDVFELFAGEEGAAIGNGLENGTAFVVGFSEPEKWFELVNMLDDTKGLVEDGLSIIKALEKDKKCSTTQKTEGN